MGYRRLTQFAGLLALCVPGVAQASQAAVTALLPQYPRAELVEFTDTKENASHEIILGTVKNVGGIQRPEASKFVVGRRLATTWLIPDEERTDVVHKFFYDALSSRGEILFECKGYNCGSSNYWANTVFGRSILYGPAQYQHYFVTRVDEEETYYISTYIGLRGTRKLYAHADVIAIRSGDQTDVDGAVIVSALEQKGRFVIDSGNEGDLLGAIVDAMAQKPLLRIAVVSHSAKQRGESVDQAIARTEQRAVGIVDQLIEMGVNRTRIEAHGVGPLAPLERGIVDRTEVVLIN